ncbi:DUF1002 domain-containing protein [Streptococcus dentiloxodontae]
MKLKKILLAGVTLLASIIFAGVAQAASSDVQGVIDETYVQPDYVLGYSLSDSQRTDTLGLLGYNSATDTSVRTLNTSSYAKIMNVADDPSLQLYSSVKIEKLGSSETLSVNIVTPENITKVTEDMYRNAAVTLGIEHAKITVASPIAVTGESALAGIYYSLEENGAQIPDETKQVAQEELDTLSEVNETESGSSNYDADKLNVAMTDIKTAVADAGDGLTKEDAKNIVNKTLNNYNLNLSDNSVNLIVNYAINLSNSSVIDNSSFTDSLKNLKDSIVEKAGDNFKGINLDFDASSAIESGKNFFVSLWDKIVDWFSSLGN